MRDEERRRYEIHATSNLFKRRIAESRTALEQCVGLRTVVSTSWGKDSCVCVHLAQEVLGMNVECVHLRSPYELPGGEHVEAWFVARGAICTDIHAKWDLRQYIEFLQGVGLEYQQDARGRGKRRKVNALHEWYDANAIEARVGGVRAEESKGRKLNFGLRGLHYQLRSGVWSCNPLAWWTPVDVWAYLVTHGVPWHPLYDCETHGFNRERNRNSGWLTMPRPERVDWLRTHYPEQWRVLVREFPSARLV